MEEIGLMDTHAHLDELDDLPKALSEAKTSGIKGIVAVGMDFTSNQRTLDIARVNWKFVFPAIGLHPWKIKKNEVEKNLSFIRDHIHESTALGEIGLDYKVKTGKELQWKIFQELLDLANEYGKPVLLHSRFSHKRTFEMVAERGLERAVFHWYSGPLDLLDNILDQGYFISATPALTYSPFHQEAIKKAPLDRILLETDTPVSYQGKESRPKDVTISLKEVARLKKMGPLQVAHQTTLNAIQFFQIGSSPSINNHWTSSY